MPTARCLIRHEPHYRREAFERGLAAAGYTVVDGYGKASPGDVIVMWNRYGHFDAYASEQEAAGAAVLVVENGWIGADAEGRQLYAICGTHHNGAGVWSEGQEDRWSRLNIPLQPWRRGGNHILVLPQRGIGPPGVAMPAAWTATIVGRLQQMTDRPIKVRVHPGKERPPLEPDLEDCWAVVTWGSGAAVKALVAGVPVFHDMPNWIGAPAARRLRGAVIERPFLGDRLPMLRRLAWAQWTVDEIRSGEPFLWLLT